jgi:hypothetical protein
MSVWDESWSVARRAADQLAIDRIEPIMVRTYTGMVDVCTRWDDLERAARSVLGDSLPEPERRIQQATVVEGWRETVTYERTRDGVTVIVTSSHPVRIEVRS